MLFQLIYRISTQEFPACVKTHTDKASREKSGWLFYSLAQNPPARLVLTLAGGTLTD